MQNQLSRFSNVGPCSTEHLCPRVCIARGYPRGQPSAEGTQQISQDDEAGTETCLLYPLEGLARTPGTLSPSGHVNERYGDFSTVTYQKKLFFSVKYVRSN